MRAVFAIGALVALVFVVRRLRVKPRDASGAYVTPAGVYLPGDDLTEPPPVRN